VNSASSSSDINAAYSPDHDLGTEDLLADAVRLAIKTGDLAAAQTFTHQVRCRIGDPAPGGGRALLSRPARP
jgi:hypothetical protein